MKWVPIAKAKVKFQQDYLITNGATTAVAKLVSTTSTASGLRHEFEEGINDVTHVALITLPE